MSCSPPRRSILRWAPRRGSENKEWRIENSDGIQLAILNPLFFHPRLSPRPCFLDFDQLRHDHLVRVTEGFEKDEVERRRYYEERAAGDEVMSPHAFPARRERDQPENGEQDDDGVETG